MPTTAQYAQPCKVHFFEIEHLKIEQTTEITTFFAYVSAPNITLFAYVCHISRTLHANVWPPRRNLPDQPAQPKSKPKVDYPVTPMP